MKMGKDKYRPENKYTVVEARKVRGKEKSTVGVVKFSDFSTDKHTVLQTL